MHFPQRLLPMPEINGLAVQERLASAGESLPIVFLSARGDIPQSVRAIKAGAEDFLTKPVKAAELIPAIRAALANVRDQHAQSAERDSKAERLARLTLREREVLRHVIAGKTNKQIATALGTGERNIKVHRGRAMRKLDVDSLAELVRLAERLGVPPATFTPARPVLHQRSIVPACGTLYSPMACLSDGGLLTNRPQGAVAFYGTVSR